MERMTYRDAGVDIDAGNESVSLIKDAVRATYRSEVIGDLGGFGGLFALNTKDYKEPVLVSGTDGVGTKLCNGGSGRSSSEMVISARQGQSSSSNGTSMHQWTTTDTLEKSVELEWLWRGKGQWTGIASELGAGTAARGLPGRAAASYGVVEV